MAPISNVKDETVDQAVARLLGAWREETAFLSSSTRMSAHPAYQELIALSPAALPSLFRDLEKTGDGHLANALSSITGANPICEEDRGRIGKIADAWLQWARENGYQW